MEFPETFGLEEETAVITAKTAVIAELSVRVPFPEKYIESKLHIEEAEPFKPIRFVLPVSNYGTKKIHNIMATVEILGSTYEKIAEIETDQLEDLNPKEENKLVGIWVANANPGTYHAKVTIYYDEEKLELEQNFKVGSLFIDIVKIETGKFSLGDIAVFDIYLENKWNEMIEGVYGEMTVSDKENTEYTKFKTASVDIDAFSREKIQAYWNTKDASIGIYDVDLIIHYADRTTKKIVEAQVNLDSIKTSLSPTARVVGVEKGSSRRDSILGILVVTLVIINIGWFIYFKKRRR